MQTTVVRRAIDEQVIRMFALVSEGIAAATESFLGGDIEVARRLIADDLLINELQQRIESVVEHRFVRCRTASQA
jgi:hypothetical protein